MLRGLALLLDPILITAVILSRSLPAFSTVFRALPGMILLLTFDLWLCLLLRLLV